MIAGDPDGGPDIPRITTKDLRRTGYAIIAEAWRRMDDLRKVPADRRYRPLRPLAELYRNGLILVILSYATLRLADLSRLMKDVSFKRVKTSFVLSYKTRKTGKQRFVVLPATLNPIIERYFDIVRPEIADADPSVVWVSREGGALTPSAFQRIVPTMTLEHCGIRIYCHLLRHIRASSDVTSTDPHKGSKSLGHRDQNTAPRIYRRQEIDWETVVEMERDNDDEDLFLGEGETVA